MERAPTLDDYTHAPLGRFAAGEGWLHFSTNVEPFLAGVVLWGAISVDAIEAVLRCATAATQKLPKLHAAIVDGRRARSLHALCFPLVSEYVIRQRDELARSVSQLAGVRTTGMIGAISEGFFRIVPAPYPVNVFEERGEALRWLGCEAHASAIDEVEERATRTVSSIASSVHQVLSDLLRDGGNPDIDKTARSMSMSVRSLQRRLHEEGTSFQRELNVARVRRAQRLMLDTDASLTTIAIESGFASPSAFSVAFRKLEGMSPSDWRSLRGQRP